ncbi:MAG: TIGR00282 family metallophosphoesterase [Clostridiaceae bacterium]|nr:TIGR00282 family metallophosphoesterase [Clostridiaceae bacterium]
MRLLAIGDVCGTAGVDILRKKLGALRRQYGADLCVVNGENACGRGISPAYADDLFAAGADVITLGNHTFADRRICDYLDERRDIIRPLNLPASLPGAGYALVDCRGIRVCVVNLQGRLNLDFHAACPFEAADAVLKKGEADLYIFDFHAEATSEKKALGHYLDGRAAVVFGTHTHVPTADICVLPGGTGYITDLGMTGPQDSVIGVRKEQSIEYFRHFLAPRFQVAEGDVCAQGALFELDGGRCTAAERVEMT